MKIGHDKEANTCDDDAGKLNFVIGVNAASEVVSDFLIKYGDSGTSY